VGWAARPAPRAPRQLTGWSSAPQAKGVAIRVKHALGKRRRRMLTARGETTTNTVDCYFSIFKRGMVGIYQHCDERHLHRYLKEFDFRYSNRIALGVDDGVRTSLAINKRKEVDLSLSF
jgi:hypothetical protein